jgi:hypothetical protein
MENSPAFVMVPCTTNLRGKYRIHIQDPHEKTGSDFYPECRVHAIGHRDVDVKTTAVKGPDRAGTWYLITLKELSWTKNPIWVHESDSNLDLAY